jgi:pimeloyl-ACP methyl ester carboxylesterase
MRLALTMLSLLCWACSSKPATEATPAETPQIETIDAAPEAAKTRAIHVRVVGDGRPMILIPGLACSGDVWRGAVERFSKTHQLHIVTIAGFAGTDRIEPPLLDSARKAILNYIDKQRLDAPIVMGHSLGAMLALWLAGSSPGATGPVIALDGLAYGAALSNPDATPDTMRPRAELLRTRAAALADDEDAARGQARAMFAPMVTDPDDLAWILEGVFASDPIAIGQAIYEMLTTDARPYAAAISSPVLMVVAGDHFAGDPEPDVSGWERQIAGIERHELIVVPDAKHFVMVDAPDFVYDEVARFIAAP